MEIDVDPKDPGTGPLEEGAERPEWPLDMLQRTAKLLKSIEEAERGD